MSFVFMTAKTLRDGGVRALWVVHGLEGSGAIGCVPCMISCVTDRGGALHAECESESRNPTA